MEAAAVGGLLASVARSCGMVFPFLSAADPAFCHRATCSSFGAGLRFGQVQAPCLCSSTV